MGSYKDPRADTNLCRLICILTLTHPSSVPPVITSSIGALAYITTTPPPLSTGESSLTGFLDARNHRQYQTLLCVMFFYTVHNTYDKV